MLLVVGSTLISAGALAGTWLISHGKRVGWMWMLLIQVPGGAYDVVTHQYGFVLLSVVGAWIYLGGWKRVKHQ